MTIRVCANGLASVLALWLSAPAGPAFAGQAPVAAPPPDLIAFSRIDRAWAHSQGSGATVAVIDWQFDPGADAAASFVSPTSLVPGERMGELKPWHGAWMVGIVHRIAPGARIIPIIGRSLAQRSYQESIAGGIRYAAEHGAVAVASSMGPVKQTPELREAIDFAERRGTLFVDVHPELVPAPDGRFRPCRSGECDARVVHPGVVSVPVHPVAPDSARDVYTWPYAPEVRFQDGWGFSMGPPIVAGVLALMKSANPDLSPRQLRELLVRTAYEREGFRVLDAEAAVRSALAAR